MIRLLIAGSRSLEPTDDAISALVDQLLGLSVVTPIECVISGRALGVDQAGERWAKARNIKLDLHPVTDEEWKRRGQRAGHERNIRMGDACTHGVLIRSQGISNGTDRMLAVLQTLRKPYIIDNWGHVLIWTPAPESESLQP